VSKEHSIKTMMV